MLQLSYTIEPDEHGVFDGRDLARAMIRDAYRLLLPYVDSCPACGDNLFSVLANGAIEEIHQSRDLNGNIMAVGQGPEQESATRAHFEGAVEGTRQLLSGSNNHEH